MGTSSSSLHELRDNKYLQRFSGKESISPNDPFWNQLLSFTFVPPHSCADCHLLEDSISPMLDALLNNNPLTGNVIALIKNFLLHASELKAAVQCENSVFIWQAYNSLFILRCVLKYFIETLGEEGMLKQLEDSQQRTKSSISSEPEKLLESIINTLFEIIIGISLDNKTYAITLEAVHTLVVLLSVQMFSSRPAHMSVVYSIVMKNSCSAHSHLLMKTLLQHYSSQDKCPHCVNAVDGNSLITGLASSLWNVLSFNYSKERSPKDASYMTVLANQSLLLLLVLVNHCSNDSEITNPYRSALFSFKNTSDLSEIPSDNVTIFKLDYEVLFKTLCETLKDDQTALLVYILLHQNSNFRHYVIFTSEIYKLVIPLLKLLYNAPEKNSHLIYMALIILLILSEEEHFGKKIHTIKLKNITWYTERMLSEISLGGLIVLILIRTIQYNMTRMHDKYLHTNCLAALANMSAYVQNLHPYVCQKFVSLMENMGKRYLRITCQSKSAICQLNEDDYLPSDLMQDMSVLEEVLRMLLEILNSCLTLQLQNNIDLLYTILYKKEIFCMFRSNTSFQDVMQNIDTVLMFFSEHLESIEQNLSVLEVSEFIKSVSMQWSNDKMKKLPELKFKYVEEGQPEDFFIPYLWSIVFHSSDIYWNSKNILIFNPYKPT